MNSHLPPSRRASHRARASTVVSVTEPARLELGWIHDGIRHRATLWPDVRFERETSSGEWGRDHLGEDVFASAALGVTGNQWRRYLEFVPAAERAFLTSAA